MKDIMIDVETLGTRSDAMIVQIGACYFDRETGEIGDTFSANIEPGNWVDEFTVDYDTIKWWMNQSPEARAAVFADARPIGKVFDELMEFLDCEEGVQIWSHATFDMPILMKACTLLALEFPLPYRAMRDIRTLMDLADHHSEKPREGIHHNALDDCKYQVSYVVEAMQKLHGKTSAV